MRMRLLVAKGGATYDMTPLVESVTWSGRKSSAPRTLEVSMLDSDRLGHNRPGIDVEEGHQCAFYWDDRELFRGIFMRQQQKKGRVATFKAYDNAVYLANNSDTFVYKKQTATQIFNDICTNFSWAHTAVDTGYVITDHTMPNTSAIDCIWSALAKTYKATGNRYYVVSDKGVLKLIARADNVKQWVIEEGSNLLDFEREKSIEEVRTRVKLLSDANQVLAEAVSGGVESKIGVMQHTEDSDAKESRAKLQSIADALLNNLVRPKESFTLECLGIPDVTSGIAVWVRVPFLNLQQTFYVDEDSHTFEMNAHTMSLTLNATNDVEGLDKLKDEET